MRRLRLPTFTALTSGDPDPRCAKDMAIIDQLTPAVRAALNETAVDLPDLDYVSRALKHAFPDHTNEALLLGAIQAIEAIRLGACAPDLQSAISHYRSRLK